MRIRQLEGHSLDPWALRPCLLDLSPRREGAANDCGRRGIPTSGNDVVYPTLSSSLCPQPERAGDPAYKIRIDVYTDPEKSVPGENGTWYRAASYEHSV